MKYALDKGAHSVCALQYHLVQCLKHRKKEVVETLKSKVLNNECGQDHFHMLFKAGPTLDIPRYRNAIKILTSRELRRKFPEVKEKLWGKALWSKTCFLATTGQASLCMLTAYFDNQEAE